MPKISIYVPDEMKARMDEADRRANWSAIAQRAFEIELGHVESVKEVKTMTDVIERLRASKEDSTKASRDYGRTAGQEWAKKIAEWEELKRLSEFDAQSLYEGYVEYPDWHAREVVTTIILGDDLEAPYIFRDNDEMAKLYGVPLPDLVDATLTVDFFVGFVEGASEVWDEIKDEI